MKNQIILSILICSSFVFQSFGMEPESVDPAMLRRVYDYTLEENKEQINAERNPLIIMLSGCAGMGKTAVAKWLQKKLNLLRFNGDDTRVFLRYKCDYFHPSLPAKTKVGRVLSCFSDFVTKIKEKPNKAVIFDESIDRANPPIFNMVSKIAKQLNFPTFVIRLLVSKSVALARILAREHNLSDERHREARKHFDKHFDTYYGLYETFDSKNVDISLDNEGPIDKLEERGQQLLLATRKRIDVKK